MSQSITEQIKRKAVELGFSMVGVTSAKLLEAEGERLKEWIANNYHASMFWLEKNINKRLEPAKILSNVKSVLCVALNYYTNAKYLESKDCGKISRYACGKDYHTIMENKLQSLLNYIKELNPNTNGKYYVDTGPVMEKVWAARAGIGWIGKHTNIVTRNYGSWIFLGEILIDYELTCDTPIPDFCGTCSACIDACPTKAIVQPYVLDSRKCISYLTIEHKGELPKEFVSSFRNWIYGCDICQEVCPWNRFQKQTQEVGFLPNKENVSPKLLEIIKLTKEEFDRRFKDSPIKRTKHSGLIRNAKAIIESVS